ncbi:hypothetical protein N9N28_16135 [Rubripirellula amarantea]|nr:hypothetical protein [Rubripirellula amarantea]
MASPYASPLASDLPTRGVLWVLHTAGATLAIAAWMVLLLHVVLVVRAEQRLARVVADANVFAELPEVTPSELTDYTHRRLARQGFSQGQVRLVFRRPACNGGDKIQVHEVHARPTGTAIKLTEAASTWLTGSATIHAGGPSEPHWPFNAK